MSIFDIDINKLSAQLIPQRLRQARISALVEVMVSPLAYLLGLFGIERAKTIYELMHNGQICRLEAVLNDRFDNTLRRIYIEEGTVVLAKRIYRRAELKPLFIRKRSEASPIYLRKRSELSNGGTFVIKVPVALIFDTAEMVALTNKYKLAGKAYTIKTF